MISTWCSYMGQSELSILSIVARASQNDQYWLDQITASTLVDGRGIWLKGLLRETPESCELGLGTPIDLST